MTRGQSPSGRLRIVPMTESMTTSLTWTDAIAAWARALRAAGRASTTIRTRTQHLTYMAATINLEPWDVTSGALLDWLGSQDWQAETRHAARSSLRSFYAWAVSTGRTTTDPARDLPAIRRGTPTPRPLPERALAEALGRADERVRLMIRLAASVGLRRGEVARLHSDDVMRDLDGWSLVVHGKGGKVRYVPLPTDLGETLASKPRGYVFPGEIDGHLSPWWVGKLVAEVLPDGWTMHTLRHRFATRAYALDKDVFAVQELLGHASPETTRRYVLLPQDAKRRIVDAIAA